MILNPRLDSFMYIPSSHNRSVTVGCSFGPSSHIHYYVTIYIQFGCVVLQQASYHVRSCMVYIRPRSGLLNANIQAVHNFLPYYLENNPTPGQEPNDLLHSLRLSADGFLSTLTYRTSNTFAATVKQSSTLGAVLTNLLAPIGSIYPLFTNLAYQAHFKMDLYFHYFNFLNLNLSYHFMAPIVSMASFTVPKGQYKTMRSVWIDISELAMSKYLPQYSKIWKHFITHVILQRTPDCTHMSDTLTIIVEMYTKDLWPIYLEYEYIMYNIPVYIFSYHNKITFQFKYVLQCGVYIDYQSIVVQSEKEPILSVDCAYLVSKNISYYANFT